MYHISRELKVVVREDGNAKKAEEQNSVLAELNQQEKIHLYLRNVGTKIMS